MSSNTYDNKPKINNSEILFIYEAKLCNPNGDPDDENKPRIDPKTRVNLVSDVRLKRFFRNYIIAKYGEDKIWVSTVNGSHTDAGGRLDALLEKSNKRKDDSNILNVVLENCIDARLFGATIPIKGKDRERGESYSIIGPVQFTWGFSLHPVELVDSPTITSMFKGRETEAEAGTIGKDWRLYYSLIAFYGVVSGMRAKDSMLSENDVKLVDNMLWESVVMDATTRSKIGHMPHLYLRVEYNDNNRNHLLGDLRRFVSVKVKEERPIRDLKDLEIDLSRLREQLQNNKDKIKSIYIRYSDEFRNLISLSDLKDLTIIELPHANIALQ